MILVMQKKGFSNSISYFLRLSIKMYEYVKICCFRQFKICLEKLNKTCKHVYSSIKIFCFNLIVFYFKPNIN